MVMAGLFSLLNAHVLSASQSLLPSQAASPSVESASAETPSTSALGRGLGRHVHNIFGQE